jgi:superfamily II DNA or RNA helicase
MSFQNVQKPTLILSHNKTLAAQLYAEFKHFFQITQSIISLAILITTNQKQYSTLRYLY